MSEFIYPSVIEGFSKRGMNECPKISNREDFMMIFFEVLEDFFCSTICHFFGDK
jgi:hypothetical protein